MLIRLILSPADEHRSGANQMRQHLSFREHFRRGNAVPIQIAALHREPWNKGKLIGAKPPPTEAPFSGASGRQLAPPLS
jgi:hypothetical protein